MSFRVPAAGCSSSEVETLSRLLEAGEHPFVAVLGGAKVSDKLGVIDALLERCDAILVGGAMMFTFLLAQGHSVGDSLVEPEMVEECRRLLETGRVRIPTDVVVAEEITDDAEARVVAADAMPADGRGSTSGPRPPTRSRPRSETRLCSSGTGRWACSRWRRSRPGPARSPTRWRDVPALPWWVAVTARPPCDASGSATRIDHVSTGGGASLEFIEQGDLPGLKALRESTKMER